ncbi:hypothetical protein SAMN05660284_01229 [Formivibrio citricus]|uniref:Uncharacterized protein n=1 Tax=Formivibrio citricus TaxID=83765 RepID=A0A1I4Y5R5_9NEIS|nr:DUF6709 family protein [Formivibrio citricus]SFN33345.1 hypothetical protein SAMN05660284_01229 [Formivibrio citricus]
MNWIEKNIRRVSVARMVLAVVVIAVIVLALAANARYFRNFFKGPYAITPAELAAAPSADALPRYWVSLKADQLVESGFQEITIHKKRGVERSREVSANYFVAVIGDRLLLVKAHQDMPTAALNGTLKPIAGKADLGFFNSPQVQKHRARFYPMMLDTENFKSNGEFGLAVAALLGIGALVYGLIALRRFRDPAQHPVMKRVAEWADSVEMSKLLEKEATERNGLKFGGHLFTANFVVREGMLNFDVQRLDETLWTYKHVLQKKIYYIIPAGKTFSVCLNWMGASWQISGKEANIDSVLQYLAERYPWMLCGYSDELASAYKKNRGEVAGVVFNRRKEALAGVNA